MRLVRVLVIIAVLLAVIPAHAQTPQETAQAYNFQGIEAYRHFDFKSAEEFFRRALKEDPNHALANYNLACVLALGLSRDHDAWAEIDADPAKDPFEPLARAIAVDPQAAQKAAHDVDFAKVRLTPRFQKLIGADMTDSRLIEILLVAQCDWFGPTCGVGCRDDLMFFENGEVKKRNLRSPERGPAVREYESGQYSIESGTINLRHWRPMPFAGCILALGPGESG